MDGGEDQSCSLLKSERFFFFVIGCETAPQRPSEHDQPCCLLPLEKDEKDIERREGWGRDISRVLAPPQRLSDVKIGSV